MMKLCVISDDRAFKSRSPEMFRKVFAALKIDGEYTAVRTMPDKVARTVTTLRANGFTGANVTVPHKQAVMEFLDEIADDAISAQAVNTIQVRFDGKLVGYNTDVRGFLDAMKLAGVSVTGKKILVVGTGGAARGILVALNKAAAAEIILAGRTPEKTREMAQWAGAANVDLQTAFTQHADAQILINASAVSTAAEAPELAAIVNTATMNSCEMVCDINYARQENFWQALAHRCGAKFSDGLPMLACQARRSLEYWTAKDQPCEPFLDALGVKH